MTTQSEDFMKKVDASEELDAMRMSTEEDTFSKIAMKAEGENAVQQSVLLDAEEDGSVEQTIKLPKLVQDQPGEEKAETLAFEAVEKNLCEESAATAVIAQKDSVSVSENEIVSQATNDVQKREEKHKVARGCMNNLRIELKPIRSIHRYWLRDPWLITTLLCASLASISSLIYYFQNHQILLMNDSYSHMLIARRVFDNLTPGITQLGGIWLPLPHILIIISGILA